MMLDYLTGSDIYASIKMLRAAKHRPTLLVEGTSEYQFLKTHVSTDLDLVNCHGCRNLDGAKQLANAASDPDVAALRDRDWYGVLYPDPMDPTLFLTDLYDLDSTIMLSTDAARRVAEVFADSDNLSQWRQRNAGLEALKALERVAERVGLLRLASERHGLGIKTDRTPIGPPMTDLETALLDDSQLISMAMSRSGQVRQPAAEVRLRFDSERALGHSPERVCCGHDLAYALSLFISGPWGGARHTDDFLLSAIRAALSRQEFRNLGFVAPIEAWASTRNATSWSR